MAIQFDQHSGSGQRLRLASAGVGAAPLSMSAWARTPDTNTAKAILDLNDSGLTGNNIVLFSSMELTGQVRWQWNDGGGVQNANTTTAMSANTWHHGCGIAASATDRKVYIDGGSEGTSTVSVTPTGIDETFMGYHTSSLDPVEYVAEAAIWNRAITSAEKNALAKGYSPLWFPRGLIFYNPGLRPASSTNGGLDWITGSGMPLSGGTSISAEAHPLKIIYPPWIGGLSEFDETSISEITAIISAVVVS